MFQMKFVLITALSIATVAFACKCRLPTDEGAFCGSDFVSHIKIITKETEKTDNGGIHYTVEHVDTFKSSSSASLSCDIYTSGSSASCGIDRLEVGKEYLVAGYLDKKKLNIGSCGQFQGGNEWETVTESLKKQLKTRFKCPKNVL